MADKVKRVGGTWECENWGDKMLDNFSGWPPEMQYFKYFEKDFKNIYIFQIFSTNRLHINSSFTFHKLAVDILLNGELRI